jgi:Group II intron, maturase-specific domain
MRALCSSASESSASRRIEAPRLHLRLRRGACLDQTEDQGPHRALHDLPGARQPVAALNPILRGWAAYFRYASAKRTFAYLGNYAWWRVMRWLRKKHPKRTWKQLRRRYFGKNGIQDTGITLYNPAAMRVERYRYRGALISTPWNEATADPTGGRYRRIRHDDPLFLERLEETLA